MVTYARTDYLDVHTYPLCCGTDKLDIYCMAHSSGTDNLDVSVEYSSASTDQLYVQRTDNLNYLSIVQICM